MDNPIIICDKCLQEDDDQYVDAIGMYVESEDGMSIEKAHFMCKKDGTIHHGFCRGRKWITNN